MELDSKRRCNRFVYLKCGNDPAYNLSYKHLRQMMVYQSTAFCLHGLVEVVDAYLNGRKPSRCGTIGKKKAFFTMAHRLEIYADAFSSLRFLVDEQQYMAKSTPSKNANGCPPSMHTLISNFKCYTIVNCHAVLENFFKSAKMSSQFASIADSGKVYCRTSGY